MDSQIKKARAKLEDLKHEGEREEAARRGIVREELAEDHRISVAQETEERQAAWRKEETDHESIRVGIVLEKQGLLEDVSRFFVSRDLSLLNDSTQITRLRVQKQQLDDEVVISLRARDNAKLEATATQNILNPLRSQIAKAKQEFNDDKEQRRITRKEEVAKQVAEQIAALRENDAVEKGGILEDVSPLQFFAFMFA